MKMQRAKRLSTQTDPDTAQVETICIGQIFTEAIIISFAFTLFFPLREREREKKLLTFSDTIYKTKILCSSHLLCQEKKRKRQKMAERTQRAFELFHSKANKACN